MKKYRVMCTMPVYMTIEVEADSKDDAIELAGQEMYLTNYCGNGGTDKLVGVTGNISIEGGDCPLEGVGFDITAEETD